MIHTEACKTIYSGPSGFISFLVDNESSGTKRQRGNTSEGLKLTMPKTPQLQTRGRQRQKTVMSHQELEDKEVEAQRQ